MFVRHTVPEGTFVHGLWEHRENVHFKLCNMLWACAVRVLHVARQESSRSVCGVKAGLTLIAQWSIDQQVCSLAQPNQTQVSDSVWVGSGEAHTYSIFWTLYIWSILYNHVAATFTCLFLFTITLLLLILYTYIYIYSVCTF